MRVLLLRISALGTVVLLGWIAMANAQRGSSSSAAGESAGDGSTVTVEGPSRPMVAPLTDDANPLRASVPASVRSIPPSTPPATEPAARRLAADPFGLQARRSGTATAAEPSRYSQMAAPASAEQPSAGPTLIPSDSSRSANDRYATRPDQTVNRGNQRYAAPAATDNQEPAPFKIDPFATPASPMRATKADRGPVGTAVELPPHLPDSSRTAELGAEGEGAGQPGGQQLDGVQSPQLTVQKFAPKEIQMGKPASFRITIRNTGQIPACEVEVRDVIPKGTRLLGTAPQASRGARGEIVWTLGTIRPGEEWTGEMQLMPTAEGEIGSVATVHFGADASARSIATRPQLVLATTGPSKVLIGDQAMLSITISNPGTGVATGVVLEERIPPGLQHPAGAELEYEVGDLKPGESRKLELPLVANRPGPATNLLSARGDGNLRAEDKLDIEVLAPQLDVGLEGPKRRYLERQAVYQLSVTNPGTAPAKQIELVASLPPGLKFISANNAGYYEESTRTVRWRLEELPVNETGEVKLVTMPIDAGRDGQSIKLRATAQKNLSVEKEQPVVIEGIAAILFQVADAEDPIGVGGETSYEVHVVNQGSKAASNVQLVVDLPPEVKFAAAEGPTRYRNEGNRVIFEGLARLAPKADTTYRVRIKAIRPGDLRTRFQLLTDDMQSPVTKEESTRVYADE